MTVAELQLLLSDLAKFLRASQAAKVAGELELIGSQLTPFKDYTLKAFADFLVKAEQYSRGALAPPTPRAKKAKADPAAIDQACHAALEIYGKAIDPSVTLEQIESAMRRLEEADPPKARLAELARQLGYTQKFKNKADAVKAIRQKIIGRKGAFERPNA